MSPAAVRKKKTARISLKPPPNETCCVTSTPDSQALPPGWGRQHRSTLPGYREDKHSTGAETAQVRGDHGETDGRKQPPVSFP